MDMATIKQISLFKGQFPIYPEMWSMSFFHSPLILNINTTQYEYSTMGQENKGLI